MVIIDSAFSYKRGQQNTTEQSYLHSVVISALHIQLSVSLCYLCLLVDNVSYCIILYFHFEFYTLSRGSYN